MTMKEKDRKLGSEKKISRLGRRGISLLLAFGLFISAFYGIVFFTVKKEAKAAASDNDLTIFNTVEGYDMVEGTQYSMTSSEWTFQLKSKEGVSYDDPTEYQIDWVAQQGGDAADVENKGLYCTVKAKAPGTVVVAVTVTNKNYDPSSSASWKQRTTSCTLVIDFQINTQGNNQRFKYIYNDDTRRSLWMYTNTQPEQMKLTLGRAEDAEWDIPEAGKEVAEVSPTGLVTPVGAGFTTLYAKYTTATGEMSDEINIYVVPRVGKTEGSWSEPEINIDPDRDPYLYVDAYFPEGSSHDVSDKVYWSIEEKQNNVWVEISNSEGLTSEKIQMAPAQRNRIAVTGLAGTYRARFYVYNPQKTANMKDLGVDSYVPTEVTLYLKSAIKDKELVLGIGDSLRLYESYNMKEDTFKSLFDCSLVAVSGDPKNYVRTNSSSGFTEVTGLREGDVIVRMTVKAGQETAVSRLLPDGTTPKAYYDTKLSIADGVMLSPSEMTLNVGETKQLSASLKGGGIDPIVFASDDPSYVTVDQNGVVTGVKETTYDVRVTATVHLSGSGMVRVASVLVKVIPGVTKFTLDHGNFSIDVGKSETIATDIKAPKAPLRWVSTKEDIFTVTPADDNKSALIKGVSGGVGTLLVENTTTGDRISIDVTVVIPIEKLELPESITLPFYQKGHNMMDELKISPADATSSDLTWISRNTEIATIDKKGYLKFVAPGRVLVTCKPTYNPNYADSQIEVYITGGPDDVIFDNIKDGALTLESGKTFTVNYHFVPETAQTNLKLYMSKEGICTIQPNEKKKQLIILGKDPGTTTVSVKTDDNVYYSFTVTVTKGSKSVSFKDADKGITLYRGDPNKDNVNLSKLVQVEPKDSTDTLSYGTLDKDSSKYIKVDAKTGVVTAVAATPAGGVYATATTSSNYTGAIKIIVVDQVTEINQDSKTKRIKVGDTITITPIIVPDTAGNKKIKWSWEASEGENTKLTLVEKISEVDVTGDEVGTAILTGVSEDDPKVKVVYIIKVVKKGNSSISYKTVVKLSPETKYADVGKKFRVHRKVTGAYKGNKALSWKSSNKKVASVTKEGRVKTKKVGKATITATAMDGSKAKGKMKIVVQRMLKDIKMSRTTATIMIGDSIQLGVSYTPSNATVKGVKWSSSDSAIATVNGGKVIGMAKGIVKISATSKDRTKKKCHCWVTVTEPQPITSFTIENASITVAKGKSVQAGITPNPTTTTDAISWWSDNPSVATVNNRGKITTHNVGQATIYARGGNGVEGHVDVTVVDLNRKAVTLRQYDKEQLSVNMISEGVTWYSADPNIAKVDENGMVTGQMPGTTIVYANVDGVKLGCRVTVTKIR